MSESTQPPEHLSVDAVRIGDQLQSAASRLVEWATENEDRSVPYEVRMAALEAQSAVDDWTKLRRRWHG